MSKLEQLHAFVKVVEYQGIGKAAEALHISAPAVTKQIQNLEQSLKTPLFDRVGRTLILTEIGRRYYQETVQTLKGLQQLESLIKTGQKEVSGILKVRTIQHFACKVLMPKLPEFLARYPTLQMNIETIESLPDFWKDQVDILYGVTMPGQPDWVQKRIGTTHYILCASTIYLERFGTPATIAELKSHRYLTHSGRLNCDTLELKSCSNLVLSPYLWFSNYESLLAATLSGLGFAWVHEYVAKKYLSDGKLSEFLTQEIATPRPIYLYYQNGEYIDPKIRAFVDFFS